MASVSGSAAIAPQLLVPGQNCWRVERAERLAVIVDAADYFVAVKSSILKAERTVFLIGWDFDTRITLDPDRRNADGPDKLGKFLSWVVDRRPDLELYLLKWDLSIIDSFGRGSTPLFILNWITDKRMHLEIDGAHPIGSAHHQKIVVIDDSVAFCGGIDITADRWDTRAHLDDDPHRRRPTTRRRYGPWHDCTTAVDGAVARALGELARDRWRRATGKKPPEVSPGGDCWPDGVPPLFEGVNVGIARTIPELGDQQVVREIEALYLSAIERAERSIYIESQYFAARRIAEALAARAAEPDGPEIVVINPESAKGWLEEAAMGSARARLFDLVKQADRDGRFRIYTPVTAGRQPIYVHAKIMIIDDWLLRVGSSNLNNRSLGYDTECDLAIEAPPGEEGDRVRRTIRDFRHDLLGEHLGKHPDVVAKTVRDASGSIIKAIDRLRGDGRSLHAFEPPEFGPAGVLAENDFLDPEGIALHRPSARRWLRAAKDRLHLAGD